jgi:hypothetical protein
MHVLIAVSIGLVFAASIQHANHPPSYPIRILFRENYAPTLQNLQQDHNETKSAYIYLPTTSLPIYISLRDFK